MVANDYQRLHHIPAEQIRLVYNGVDTQRFSPQHREKHAVAVRRELGVSASETLALFVGHDFRRKGLATAVRAVAAGCRWRRCDWRWLAASIVRGMQRQASPSGLRSGDVRRICPRSRALLRGCRYLRLAEPLRPVQPERSGSGRQRLAEHHHARNGAGELLTHARDGFVLDDPTDHEELAAHLKLLLDPVVRGAMGRAAKRRLCGTRCVATPRRSSICTMKSPSGEVIKRRFSGDRHSRRRQRRS